MNKKISTIVLAVFIGTFFSTVYANESGIEAKVLAKSSRSWDGAELPNYPNAKPEITIIHITIAPGALLPLHKHPVINAGILLSGQLTVATEENETLHMKAGDALIEVVDKWHYGKNEGSVPAEIVVFYAGTPDSVLTRSKD